MDTTVTALATAPAVLALVTLAKDLGLPTRYAALTAVVLGAGLSVADHALAGNGAYSAAASGILLGLGAAGIYDTARIVSPAPEAPAAETPSEPPTA